MNDKTFVVLMAEDDEHDIIATKRAWKASQMANPLRIVNNGEECLDYLWRRGAYSDPASSPRPGILLLDLNMPRMDGLETLLHIRKSEQFRSLPVVMLTTSKADNFSEAIRTINLFWKLVELPGG